MLMVKTFVAEDSHGGLGLFAAESIAAGTVVWTYNPRFDQFYTLVQYRKLSAEEQKIVAHHGYRATIKDVHGVLLSHDNDRYINHSQNPNIVCSYENSKVMDSRFARITAGSEIPAGNELTANYYDFDLPGVSHDVYDGIQTCSEFLKMTEAEMPAQSAVLNFTVPSALTPAR